jgi:ubiquinone/menaquinone biosynthesis C-methylase UbiE
MTRDRDVQAFHRRSARYESGWMGELHRRIADGTADIALGCCRTPVRVLDVGCGTGYLLRRLAHRCPGALEVVGVDPAPGMIEVARGVARNDTRIEFFDGAAELLPFPAGRFDLVVSTTSFHHWSDQRAGLAECHRVMSSGGSLVLTDLFSVLLLPTLLAGHHGRVRTKRRATKLLEEVGFRSATWHDLSGITVLAGTLVRTVTAAK